MSKSSTRNHICILQLVKQFNEKIINLVTCHAVFCVDSAKRMYRLYNIRALCTRSAPKIDEHTGFSFSLFDFLLSIAQSLLSWVAALRSRLLGQVLRRPVPLAAPCATVNMNVQTSLPARHLQPGLQITGQHRGSCNLQSVLNSCTRLGLQSSLTWSSTIRFRS